jgi:hypothetical protein
MDLLEYAAHMWRISGSPLPPERDTLLHRDKQWDYEVSLMKQGQDYWIDQRKKTT